MGLRADNYAVAAGVKIHGGRFGGPRFVSVSVVSEDAGVPYTTAGQLLLVELHGSAGQNTTTGRQYSAAVDGQMAYSTYTNFQFSTARTSNASLMKLRPVDLYGTYGSGRRESMWLGFKNIPDGVVRLITQRRLDAMLTWSETNLNTSKTKRYLTGESMGAWGTMTFGVRRPQWFAAIYADRPRWRYDEHGGVAVADWPTSMTNVTLANAPQLAAEDGGGSVATLMNSIAYVANTANKVPWIGWCVGWNDGYTLRSDHVAAVAALRAAKRGFAFAWNNGNHTTGKILDEVSSSYPVGLFELGVGYPLFTNHSGDGDPAVDLVGGINLGLTFRNVAESASSWSCEVTSLLGARTVTVEPLSDKFNASVVPQVVTIPAASTWVPVSFSA